MEGEREGEKHQCVVASRTPPTGDLARNPGMCPDWESNRRPFGSQSGTQSTEPHQPGLLIVSFDIQAFNDKNNSMCCSFVVGPWRHVDLLIGRMGCGLVDTGDHSSLIPRNVFLPREWDTWTG